MSTTGLVAGLASAVVFGLAAVAQAHGVRGLSSSPDTLTGFVRAGLRDPWIWLVVVAYLVGFVLHAVAIQLLPLYLAQTTVAMSLPVTALAASWVERRLPASRWAAVAVLTGGLVLVSAGAGAAGPVATGTAFGVAVGLGVVTLAGAAWLARSGGGALLGLLAGLGYAGSALSVRGIGTPLTAVVVVGALAVPAFSVVAFWQYSLGMSRSRVAAATAPLVGAQTLVPAVVGIVWLGDGVRDGWWPAVVAGVVVAIAAAVVLSVDEETREAGSEVAARG